MWSVVTTEEPYDHCSRGHGEGQDHDHEQRRGNGLKHGEILAATDPP